jgi:hypothetical protein
MAQWLFGGISLINGRRGHFAEAKARCDSDASLFKWLHFFVVERKMMMFRGL